MTTASDEGKGTRRPVMPLVAYAIVLALLVAAGVALWTAKGVPGSGRAVPPVAKAAPTEPARPAQGLKLPPRPAEPEATAPAKLEPAAAAPSPSGTSTSEPASSAAETPETRKTTCTADIGPWPTDRTDQAKAIQILLRDLGYYGGTTYGTVGPATREAIRKFQLAVGEVETGEPGETLFEQLKKKKCASAAP